MKAIISTTYDDLYLFFLPIVTWSWNKLGTDVICFIPNHENFTGANPYKFTMIAHVCGANNLNVRFQKFKCPEHKEATYAQCSRLYAASLDLPEDERLITGDVDMAVFHKGFFNKVIDCVIDIYGADLVPPNQYPMCYIAMSVKHWREVMEIKLGEPTQQYLDALIGPIECEHFRANQWALDQDTAFKFISKSQIPVIKHNRAKYPHQFASHRADRDGWPDDLSGGELHYLIDAHLPRPGYTDENFAKILKLFQDIYPEENFDWMVEYRNEYVKLSE